MRNAEGRNAEHSLRRIGIVTIAAAVFAWLGVEPAAAGDAGKKPPDWAPAPAMERLLPGSANDWEPALAVDPGGKVYVTAGRRRGSPRGKDFSQQIVIWRSDDDGTTFQGPFPVSDDGDVHGDQRVAVDGKGVLYVSYIGTKKEGDKFMSRLRLARSEDGARTFTVQTVTDKLVSDKPELAVSANGSDIYLAYESRPGPKLISSHDGGKTWDEGRVVEQSEGRHFWPTGLAVGPGGELWFAVPSVPNAELQKGGPTVTTLHVFRSADRGETWHRSPFGKSPWVRGGCAHDSECRVKINYIGVAADGKGRGYVAYTEGAAAKQPYALYFKSTGDGGQTWSAPERLSAAPRPKSKDDADYDLAHIAAEGDGRVCVLWVDDRLGAKNVWARCSGDAGRSWGAETLLSNRNDGAAYKSAEGFELFYGHYGGVAITPNGRLHAAWPEGPKGGDEGAVWVNHLDTAEERKP